MGRRSAIVAAGPRPGRTPMAVPIRAPRKANRILVPVRAMENPLSRPLKISMRETPLLSQKQLLGDGHFQKVDEKDIHSERSEHRDERCLEPLLALDQLFP